MKEAVHEDSGAVATETRSASGPASLRHFLETADLWFRKVDESLQTLGLSFARYEVLAQLRDADAPLSLKALADGQSCAASNITQLVDRLEEEKLVARLSDPGDRRTVLARLTEAGATTADDAKIQLDVVTAQFAANFTAAERKELGRLLDKIG